VTKKVSEKLKLLYTVITLKKSI